MTTIGNLVTKFTVEGMDSVHNAVAQYGKEVEAAEKENKDFNKGLSAIGGSLLEVGAGMTAAAYIIDKLFIKSFTKAYESVAEFNRMTGTTVQQGGKWHDMLEGMGMDISIASNTFKILSNNVDAAINDEESGAAVAFRRLGVSLVDSNGYMKDANTVLLETISALQKLEAGTERNALANDTLGRSYQEWGKILDSDTDILQKYGDTQTEITQNGMESFKEYEASVNKLNAALSNLQQGVGSGLIPMLTLLANLLNATLVPAFNVIADKFQYTGYLAAATLLDPIGVLFGKYSTEAFKQARFLANAEGTVPGKQPTKAGTPMAGTDPKTNTLMKSLEEEIGINLLSIQEYLTSIDSKKTIDKDYAQDKKELDELVANTEVLINASKNQALKDMWKGLKTTIEDNPVQAFIDIQAALTMQKGGGDTGGLPGGESKGWNLGGSTWNGVGVGSQDSEMWIFMKSLYEAGYNYQDALNYWGTGETPPGVIIGTGGIKGKALGGPVMAGMPYVVGEYGPELFSPDQNGTIIPNLTTASEPVHIHVDVDGNEVASTLVDLIRVRTGTRF